jgi:hypothetical protein
VSDNSSIDAAKRVCRLYCQENLSVRNKRPRRHVTAKQREDRIAAGQSNDYWSMDFMSDQLSRPEQQWQKIFYSTGIKTL